MRRTITCSFAASVVHSCAFKSSDKTTTTTTPNKEATQPPRPMRFFEDTVTHQSSISTFTAVSNTATAPDSNAKQFSTTSVTSTDLFQGEQGAICDEVVVPATETTDSVTMDEMFKVADQGPSIAEQNRHKLRAQAVAKELKQKMRKNASDVAKVLRLCASQRGALRKAERLLAEKILGTTSQQRDQAVKKMSKKALRSAGLEGAVSSRRSKPAPDTSAVLSTEMDMLRLYTENTNLYAQLLKAKNDVTIQENIVDSQKDELSELRAQSNKERAELQKSVKALEEELDTAKVEFARKDKILEKGFNDLMQQWKTTVGEKRTARTSATLWRAKAMAMRSSVSRLGNLLKAQRAEQEATAAKEREKAAQILRKRSVDKIKEVGDAPSSSVSVKGKSVKKPSKMTKKKKSLSKK